MEDQTNEGGWKRESGYSLSTSSSDKTSKSEKVSSSSVVLDSTSSSSAEEAGRLNTLVGGAAVKTGGMNSTLLLGGFGVGVVEGRNLKKNPTTLFSLSLAFTNRFS